MITIYFSKNKKYLKKDKMVKFCNNCNNIMEIVTKINNKNEKLHIIAEYQYIVDFVMENEDFDYDYEVIKSNQELTEELVTKDLLDLYNGIIDKVLYTPHKKWVKSLGEKVYLTLNPFETFTNTKTISFAPSDLPRLYEGLEKNNEIPQELMFKMAMGCKIIV